MIFPQPQLLKRKGYKVVMWDVVTRDYNAKLSPEQVLDNVKGTRAMVLSSCSTTPKSREEHEFALPRSVEWLQGGYTFEVILVCRNFQKTATTPTPHIP